ncbi:Lichenase-2 (Fragment) [Linum perenne]
MTVSRNPRSSKEVTLVCPWKTLALASTTCPSAFLATKPTAPPSEDAVYSALERYDDGGSVKVVVSETGWPTAGGGAATTVENARVYNVNLVKRVNGGKGTLRRAVAEETEVYIFTMFNENQKVPAGVENKWGLFYPDKSRVYPMRFV